MANAYYRILPGSERLLMTSVYGGRLGRATVTALMYLYISIYPPLVMLTASKFAGMD
jgi:hypothetical protein